MYVASKAGKLYACTKNQTLASVKNYVYWKKTKKLSNS